MNTKASPSGPLDDSLEVVQAELSYLKDQFWQTKATDIIVTKSPKMKAVYEKVKAVANTSSTVLLTGETGVGKSLIAKLIHDHSIRKNEALVSLHCGAIPESLIESELFGHEKGSFTGAIRRKLGRFEIANGGTIFLDEIGTISASTQIKLLQVLQDSIFQRVGGESDIKVDVRVIAATNEDLKRLVEDKSFRADLFYRLNVFPIEIPPLRERKEDISHLCLHLIKSLNRRYNKNISQISELAEQALTHYSWPGNIRELENVIERAYIIEKSTTLSAESLPTEILEQDPSNAIIPMDINRSLAEVRNQAIEDVERQYLKEVLTMHQGKINETARTAGVGVRQIHKLMSKYGLDKLDFKSLG